MKNTKTSTTVKKVIAGALTLAMTMTAPVQITLMQAAAAQTGYVNCYLNLRDDDSADGNWIMTMSPDMAVTVEDTLINDAGERWYKVSVVTGSGSVYSGYAIASGIDLSDGGSDVTDLELTGYVDSPAGLNMRTGMGTDYGIITTLANGTTVEITGEGKGTNGNGWYEVIVSGTLGYVSASYISFEAPAESGGVTDLPDEEAYVNSSAGLNVRSGMGTSYNAITTLSHHTKLTVTGEGKDSNGSTWYRIEAGSYTGYVSAAYVTFEAPETTGVTDVEPWTGYVDTTVGLNLRSGMGTNYSVVTLMNHNLLIEITGEGKDSAGNTWYRVETGNHKGYASAQYIKKGTPSLADGEINDVDNLAATVNSAAGLNLREGMGVQYSIIRTLSNGTALTLTGEGKDSSNVIWYRVKAGDLTGYVSSQYVTIKGNQTDNGGNSDTSNTDAEKERLRQAVADYAQSFVDKLEYVWGGTSLVTGADCSGYTEKIYEAQGIDISRDVREQSTQGIAVSADVNSLLPGDLLFYATGGNVANGIGHVGIYVGNGRIAHAASKELGTINSKWNYSTVLAVRRIIY